MLLFLLGGVLLPTVVFETSCTRSAYSTAKRKQKKYQRRAKRGRPCPCPKGGK